jgi:hypothetical protein
MGTLFTIFHTVNESCQVNLKFRSQSSGFQYHIGLLRDTDISKEHTASILTVEKQITV